MKEFIKKIIAIQNELKAPKNLKNDFGGFKYRSAEDIESALKPLLKEYELLLFLTDEFMPLDGAVDPGHIKATAKITDGENYIEVSAYARESAVKKGMDASQITGSASSYARKYALCGLFLIDDTKDADSQDNSDSAKKVEAPKIEGLVTEDAVIFVIQEINKAKLNPMQSKLLKDWLKENNISLGKRDPSTGEYIGWTLKEDQLESVIKQLSTIKEPI